LLDLALGPVPIRKTEAVVLAGYVKGSVLDNVMRVFRYFMLVRLQSILLPGPNFKASSLPSTRVPVLNIRLLVTVGATQEHAAQVGETHIGAGPILTIAPRI
jgi:hypothetical protein